MNSILTSRKGQEGQPTQKEAVFQESSTTKAQVAKGRRKKNLEYLFQTMKDFQQQSS